MTSRSLVALTFGLWSAAAQAAAYGQITISSPTSGSSYSSSDNVSTSVSWSSTCSGCGLVLDRRVYNTSTSSSSSASADTCYFSPVSVSSTSGSQSGTLRDGSGSVSTSYSSASCFTGGSGAQYNFVATLVYCGSTSYSTVSSCMEDGSDIVARAMRVFSHN